MSLADTIGIVGFSSVGLVAFYWACKIAWGAVKKWDGVEWLFSLAFLYCALVLLGMVLEILGT